MAPSGFTRKIANMFGRNQAGADAAHTSASLRRGMRVTSYGFKYTDMISERDLASTRKSVDSSVKSPLIEQLSAHALLAKVLACHTHTLGRRDPRVLTRDDVLKAKVKLKAAPQERLTMHAGSGWPIFKAEKERDRKNLSIHLKKKQYYEWLGDLGAQWKAMSPAKMHSYWIQLGRMPGPRAASWTKATRTLPIC